MICYKAFQKNLSDLLDNISVLSGSCSVTLCSILSWEYNTLWLTWEEDKRGGEGGRLGAGGIELVFQEGYHPHRGVKSKLIISSSPGCITLILSWEMLLVWIISYIKVVSFDNVDVFFYYLDNNYVFCSCRNLFSC